MQGLNFTAAIFDLDGTLLDSLGVWQKIDVDFLARRGLEIPSDYAEAISGFSFRGAANYTIARFGLTVGAEELISEWYDMAVYEYSHNVNLKPHVREYLLHLQERGIKLGIATSAPAALYLPAIKRHGILDLFTVICSTENSATGKDSPEIFLQTAAELDVEPTQCLVFEDILPAIISAKQASMFVCGVYDKHSRNQWSEICRIADRTIHDFSEAMKLE